MSRRSNIDSQARRIALALGASRAAIGLGALLATRPALRVLGFGAVGETGAALGKLAGGRDLALGAVTLTAHNDRARLRTLLLTSAVLDAADAASLALATRRPETRAAGYGGIFSGGAAALAGLWAWRRLS